MNLLRHSVLSAGLHRITAVIFALSLIFTLSAFASDFYTVDTVQNPRLENTSFHVSDPASLLTHDTVSYLNEKLTQLEKDTGIQSAVVVLPSVGDSDVFEFSQALFRKWGIGQRDKNVGLAGIDCATNTPKSDFDEYPKDSEVNFEIMDKMTGFWGSAYFGLKRNYFVIPEEIKVFYGDHYLFRRNQQAGRVNYKITNISVKHLESLTSHSSKFIKKLFKSDRKYCIKYDGVEHQKLSFVQRILSLTYYHEHFVLCLLGLKH